MNNDRERPTTWAAYRKLVPFVRPHRAAILLALGFLLAESALALLKPWPLKLTLDVILERESLSGSTLYLLLAVAASVVAIAAFEGLVGYQAKFLLNRAGRTAVFDLRLALFDHLQRLSLQFHSRKSSGDVMTRVTSDVKSLRDAMTESVAEILKSIMFLIGMGVVLLWLDWRLTLPVVCAAPVLFLLAFVYSTRIKQQSRAARKREGAVATVLHESLATTHTARVFNRENETRGRFHAESAESLERGLAATLAGERFSWIADVLGAMVTAVVLGIGVQRVMSGAITAGTLIVFVSYVRRFYRPLRTAVKHANKINQATAGVERVVELLEIEEGVTDAPDARPAPPLQGSIEFRNVCFEYEPGRPVLERIDVRIAPGTVTAIVGPAGSGKSSLLSLIPRLYDPTEGAVLIDGHDIRKWTLRSLRAQISMVLQDSVLLQTSIAENIAYGNPDASLEEIVAAAQAANAHEFITHLAEGYDTVVGERGSTLSGGQLQRIAIARAIIRKSSILIFDEVTTGLDKENERVILEALQRLSAGRTTFLISHDLRLASTADSILYLEKGRIIEQGTHIELVGRNGRYAKMYHMHSLEPQAIQEKSSDAVAF